MFVGLFGLNEFFIKWLMVVVDWYVDVGIGIYYLFWGDDFNLVWVSV